MLVYLLKSGACLAILFLFYKLFLEKENMHVFKRFYLLTALLFSLIVPTLVFVEYVEAPSTTETTHAVAQQTLDSNEIINVPPALEADVLDIAPLLWGIYFLGLLFFGIKFIKNLFQIFRRIHRNPKQKSVRFTQVLLLEKIPPHTFFRYIFLNKRRYESGEIPKEVLLHEETHARQKHSFDVIFVELLQVILWINPFIYLFKKSIKLNHEFLADQAVLKKDIDKTTYQNTLLSYLSPDSEKKYQPKLANAINYSSIKKRFTVMKTHTSKKAVLLRSLLLLPLLAVLLYGFSETKHIERKAFDEGHQIEQISEKGTQTEGNLGQIGLTDVLLIQINSKGDIFLQDTPISLEDLKEHLSKINPLLSPEQKRKVIRAIIKVDKGTPKKVIDKVNQILTDYGTATINIIGPKLVIKGKSQEKASPKQVAEYNTLAKKYNAIVLEERKISLSDLKILESVYRKMDSDQKVNSQLFPECLPKKLQDGASRELMAEYNKLAKHYNEMSEYNMRIKKKDVERLEYIYGLMSDKQKADAEPFPNFPPMPDVPAPPSPPNVKKGEVSAVPPPPPAKVEKRETSSIPPPPPPTPDQVEKHISINIESEKNINRKKEGDFHLPDPPPPPKSPLDHVIEMAKKDAIFYHEGKEISSDKAIQLLKNSTKINIDTRRSNSDRPVVRLSSKPIIIEN